MAIKSPLPYSVMVYQQTKDFALYPEQRRAMANWCYERFGDDSKGKFWDTTYGLPTNHHLKSSKYHYIWIFLNEEDAVEFALRWT